MHPHAEQAGAPQGCPRERRTSQQSTPARPPQHTHRPSHSTPAAGGQGSTGVNNQRGGSFGFPTQLMPKTVCVTPQRAPLPANEPALVFAFLPAAVGAEPCACRTVRSGGAGRHTSRQAGRACRGGGSTYRAFLTQPSNVIRRKSSTNASDLPACRRARPLST